MFIYSIQFYFSLIFLNFIYFLHKHLENPLPLTLYIFILFYFLICFKLMFIIYSLIHSSSFLLVYINLVYHLFIITFIHYFSKYFYGPPITCLRPH